MWIAFRTLQHWNFIRGIAFRILQHWNFIRGIAFRTLRNAIRGCKVAF